MIETQRVKYTTLYCTVGFRLHWRLQCSLQRAIWVYSVKAGLVSMNTMISASAQPGSCWQIDEEAA